MRFVADLATRRTPVEQASRAIGSQPVTTSGRWSTSGVEIAHWRMKGPRQFIYGQQASHCVTCVHGPLENRLLVRNNRLIRQGRVDADRFRISVPGEDIGAHVTSADTIVMTQIYFSGDALEALAIPSAPLRLVDPSRDVLSREIEVLIRLLYMNVQGSSDPDWVRLELLVLIGVVNCPPIGVQN